MYVAGGIGDPPCPRAPAVLDVDEARASALLEVELGGSEWPRAELLDVADDTACLAGDEELVLLDELALLSRADGAVLPPAPAFVDELELLPLPFRLFRGGVDEEVIDLRDVLLEPLLRSTSSSTWIIPLGRLSPTWQISSLL